MVRYVVAGLGMVGIGIALVHKSLVHLCGTICQERTKITCLVSGIFLLFTLGMADTAVLTNTTMKKSTSKNTQHYTSMYNDNTNDFFVIKV